MDRLEIDFMVFGSSRPQLLNYTYNSFMKYVISSNIQINKILNEDFVYSGKSSKSVEYAKDNGFKIYENNPPIGLGKSMKQRILECNSPYIFYLQDDWEFERPVELDRLLWIMERNPRVNCITFNKYRNMKKTDFEDKEIIIDDVKFCLCPGWQFLPGIWRTSFIKPRWKKYGTRVERPEGFWQNTFGTHEQRLNHKYLEKNVGAYMLGGFGEYRYVRHIGGTWRMADWQRKNNKPGGVLHWEFMNVERDRSPWLGELAYRPLNKDIKLTDEGIKHYEKQGKHIKEIYKDALPKN